LEFLDLFFGAVDLGAVDLVGLLAVSRRALLRPVLRFDLIHADAAAELALVSSGMTISVTPQEVLDRSQQQ